MSHRAAAWLAWLLCGLSLVLTALSVLLFNLNLSHPNAYIYDYWLDNTIGTLSLAPVGALIAARRPANAVGWLLCLNGVVLSIGHFSSQYAIYTLLAQRKQERLVELRGNRLTLSTRSILLRGIRQTAHLIWERV